MNNIETLIEREMYLMRINDNANTRILFTYAHNQFFIFFQLFLQYHTMTRMVLGYHKVFNFYLKELFMSHP